MDLRSLVKKVITESLRDDDVDQFGDKRELVKNYAGWTSFKETFTSRVKSLIVDIFMEEDGISEKDHTAVSQTIRDVRWFFKYSKKARALLAELEQQDVRPRYAAEVIFRRWGELNEFREDDGIVNMMEAKTERQKLRDDQVKLTDDERAEVIVKGAVWTDGTPGIWKSVDKNGNVQYCSNTHRAMAVSPTLAQAIKEFPAIRDSA